MSHRMKARYMAKRLKESASGINGRILVLTGARQTGKTTLSKKLFSDYAYLSIEDPVASDGLERLTASQWHTSYPKAILDEVQKKPRLVESIKSVYDQWEEPRYILLGSSQLILLKKVRESLAGRCSIMEMYPLTVPEIETDDMDDEVSVSPLQKMFMTGTLPEMSPVFQLDPMFARKMSAWQSYIQYGGYPAVHDGRRDDDTKREWLSGYAKTYLERDVRDLADMRDLEPFRMLQGALALQTGSLCNVSALATHIGMSSTTVRRYLQYLSLSYQAIILPPWERNPSRRLVKAPKIHYMDYGVLQAVLHKKAAPNGNEFESLVIAEIYKQLRQTESDVQFYHLRTSDGREVDLLVETQDGYIAFEVKLANHVQRTDARHLRNLSDILDKPLLQSIVVSNDISTTRLEDGGISYIPAAQFLG